MITAEINTAGMDEVLLKLSRATDTPMVDVARAEMLSILEAGQKFTPSASVQGIKDRIAMAEWMTLPVSAYAPKRPVRRVIDTKNGPAVVYRMTNRFPAELWGQMRSFMNIRSHLRLAARGLLKKSWLQVAAHLGLDILVPGYVARAAWKGNDYPEDNRGREERSGSGYSLTGEIGRTYDRRIKAVLQRAITGRVKYFRKNLEKGVFDSLEAIERAYPNLLKINRS